MPTHEPHGDRADGGLREEVARRAAEARRAADIQRAAEARRAAAGAEAAGQPASDRREKHTERQMWWYLAYFLFGIHVLAFVMIFAVRHGH